MRSETLAEGLHAQSTHTRNVSVLLLSELR
jgi:hypothetical protein